MFRRKEGKEKKAFLGLRGQMLNHGIMFFAGMGFLLFGYDQGVMGGLLTLPSFYRTFPNLDTVTTTGAQLSHNSTLQGAAVALYEIGCFLGALSVMWLGNKLGRRKTIFYGGIVMIVGAILQTTAFSLAHLIVARIVTGVGNGFITSTVPTWQSECAKAHQRGRLVMIAGALITGGVCISYWVDFGFYFLGNSSASWRVPIALQMVFAVILVGGVLFMPESPRWLIKEGRTEEAAEVFAALLDVEADHPSVKQAVMTVKATIPPSDEQHGVSHMFTMGKKRHFHRAALGFVNQMFQQISGINLITYYAATIFQSYIGLTPTLSRILAACNGTEYFLASWIAVFIIEKVGRRKLMIFGAAGQAATMIVLTGCGSAAASNDAAAIVQAVMLFVFNTFFAIGWLGMTWLYPAEISSLEVRAPANGFSTIANWLFNFMVVMITPVSFANIDYYTYLIFAVINGAIILPISWYCFPETAGRSLEEIDEIFENTQSGWRSLHDCVKVEKKMPKVDHSKDVENAGFGDEAMAGSAAVKDINKGENEKTTVEHRDYKH